MSAERGDREGEKAEPSFKVIDRRRFAPDGSERVPETGGEEEGEGRSGAAAGPRGPTPPPGISSPSPSETSRLAEPQGGPYDPDEIADLAGGEPSFATLVLSLSTQALMCLGEIPEAPGVEPHQDLVAARHVIDLLGVLERKTQGNLTEDEHALLERILYDLRIRFVQLSGSRGSGS